MSAVVMLIGLPGSGKSTFRSKFLRAYPDHIVVSSDDFIDARAHMLGQTYSEAFDANVKMADAHCRQVFEQSLKVGASLIVDRTNLNPKSRKRFLAQVPIGYTTIAQVFEIEPDLLQDRLARREAETGKHIPTSVIDGMRASFVMPRDDEFDIIARVVQ